MKISIACMEDIGNSEAVTFRHPVDCNQNFGETRARNDGIHRDHIWCKPSHRTKRTFTSQPELGAFLIVFGNANVVGVIPPADFHDCIGGFFQAFLEAIDFYKESGSGIEWISRLVYRSLDCLDGLRVDELKSRRN